LECRFIELHYNSGIGTLVGFMAVFLIYFVGKLFHKVLSLYYPSEKVTLYQFLLNAAHNNLIIEYYITLETG
jgi:hypothetical protein